jgi:copper chaperone CopZ
MKSIFLACCIVFVLGGCRPSQKLESADIAAATMVCGKCAKTIEKAVYHVEGVKEVDVDVDKKMVHVKYVPLQTNVETLERAITDAGYDANGRKRDPDAYDKLEACCKMER